MKKKLMTLSLILTLLVMVGCTSTTADTTTQQVTPAITNLTSSPTTITGVSTAQTTVPSIASTVPVTTQSLTVKAFPGTVILGSPEKDSITLSLLTSANTDFFVQYGQAAGKYDKQTGTSALQKDQPLEFKIAGLNVDTKYYYRICYRQTGEAGFSAGDESGFSTQKAAGESFIFTIDADPHFDTNSDNNKIDLAFTGILNLHPDFDIDLGDTFMAEKMNNPTPAQVTDVYVQKRSDFGIFGGSVPVYMVTGNHDGGVGAVVKGQENSVANLASKARELYYQSQYADGFYGGVSKEVHLAGPHANYYSWEWGDALFVVLDPFWNSQKDNSGWGMSLGKSQYDWLKSTLEKSHAKYKFVFAHNLVGGADNNMRGGAEAAKFYEWGGQNTDSSWGFDSNRPGWGKPIHQLLVDNKVTIFFHGHDHFFAKQELDGVVYQECPQPGATNPKAHNDEYGYKSGIFLGSAGFIRVTVSSGSVTVDYIKTYLPSEESADHKNGEVAYSYTIR